MRLMLDLSTHELRVALETDGLVVATMRRPNTRMLSVEIVYAHRRIWLSGDLQIGEGHGLVSAIGYNLHWFARATSPEYLGEKFLLPQVWEAERAARQLREEAEESETATYAKALRRLANSLDEPFWWMTDEPTAIEFDTKYVELTNDCEVPGYGYPTVALRQLCQVQQRFAELWRQRQSSTPTVRTP